MNFDNLKAELANWRPEDFGKVAVLMGGVSAEREISLESGQAVLEACRESGMNATGLELGDDPVRQIVQAGPDWAFNIIHGGYGENGLLSGSLELLGVYSPASGGRSMALAMHKHRAKAIWRQAGLPTPDWRLLVCNNLKRRASGAHSLVELAWQEIAAAGLRPPLVIKPTCEGSSVGLYLAHTQEQLNQALAATLSKFEELLVESLITGTEITMALLGDTALPVIEIQPDRGVYDYHAKYQSNNTRMLIPTSLGEEIEARARELAVAAFESLGCGVWGRVDAMVDKAGAIHLLEINTLPGMTSHSLVPRAAAQVGLDFSQLVQAIFSVAKRGQ